MASKPTLKGINRVLTIKVTDPLIVRARQQDSSHCMIAEAVRAAIPEAKSVSVDLATIRFTDPAKGQRYIYLTPRVAQLALIDFDQGIQAQPFTFQLKKAAQVVESGRRTAPDGTQKKPSRAVQKVVGASSRRHPVKLGGDLPPVGPLSSKQSQRKRLTTVPMETAAGSSPEKKRPTAAEKRAEATRAAAKQATARAQGVPATETKANVTLGQTTSRIRKFGMKQLRP